VAAEAAEAEDPEAAAENGDVLDEEGAADGDAAAKKKKKKKKKGKGTEGTEGTEGANEDDKEGALELWLFCSDLLTSVFVLWKSFGGQQIHNFD